MDPYDLPATPRAGRSHLANRPTRRIRATPNARIAPATVARAPSLTCCGHRADRKQTAGEEQRQCESAGARQGDDCQLTPPHAPRQAQSDRQRGAHAEENADRPSQKRTEQYGPRSRVVSAEQNARIDQPEEEHHDLHRLVPFMFGVVESDHRLEDRRTDRVVLGSCGRNGTMGTSARAGCTPATYRATHADRQPSPGMARTLGCARVA